MTEDIESGHCVVGDRAQPHDIPSPERPAPGSVGATARPALPIGAALAAAAALAACGGGGGGGGGGLGLLGLGTGATTTDTGSAATSTSPSAGSLTPLAETPTAATYLYPQAKTDAEAARFLLQAQFSASTEEIAAVRAKGYLPWLGEQFDAPASQGAWAWLETLPYTTTANTLDLDAMVWKQLITSPDALRKRVALAFSEIFVVSGNDIGSNWPVHVMAQYWDVLVSGATTNFRKLIEDITLNPAMGFYLNTKGNQKENAATGRQPDENYAREVMQLMTIGLVQLNADGTVKTDAAGKPLDSYTQDDVTNLARVFTGYDLDIRTAERNAVTPLGATYTIESNAWTQRPMALTASRHSTLAANFLGTSVAAGTAGDQALKIALDALVAHPNTAPFISRQLIQRMVTSNPSAAYVKRVADVFVNNGAGVRGDMKSVIAAILLDNEARSPDGLANADFGHVREPMLRLVQWARTCGVASANGSWRIGNLSSTSDGLGQSPLRSPSVFNFYRPGYVPPSTAIAGKGMVAPEFQIVTETSVGGYINFIARILQPGFNSRDVVAAYASEKALVLDPAALVDRLALLFTANQLSAATRTLIVDALSDPAVTAASTDAVKLNRITAAVLLVMACPEYLVQK